MKATRQNQKLFYYGKLIFLVAMGRKMKSWKPLETGLLNPQISEGGIHKGNHKGNYKGNHNLWTERKYLQTRQLTRLNFQNIQIAHTTQQQKRNKRPT